MNFNVYVFNRYEVCNLIPVRFSKGYLNNKKIQLFN